MIIPRMRKLVFESLAVLAVLAFSHALSGQAVTSTILGTVTDPAGAAVLRKDTGEQLGITPFAVEIPTSPTAIGFLFKKDNFGDKIEVFVPAESGQVAVALTATAQPEQQPSRPHAEAKPDSKAGGKAPASGRRKPVGGRKHGGHAMDEDGVLAPSF